MISPRWRISCASGRRLKAVPTRSSRTAATNCGRISHLMMILRPTAAMLANSEQLLFAKGSKDAGHLDRKAARAAESIRGWILEPVDGRGAGQHSGGRLGTGRS